MNAASRPPWETDERELFRDRFGEDVDAYERTRPIAPSVVFDEIMEAAELTARSDVLEIGPGTGQVTRQLATRGLNVLAVEIDHRLAARVRTNLFEFPNVEVRESSFEGFDAGNARFDAIVACNSFHWLDHRMRFVKSAELLRPQGFLVLLSTPVVIPDGADAFWIDVQDDWEAVGADRVDPRSRHPDVVGDFREVLQDSELFAEPLTTRRLFETQLSASDFVANLSTQSAFRQIGPDAGATLLARIERRIEAIGGAVTVHHLAVLNLAQRLSPSPPPSGL